MQFCFVYKVSGSAELPAMPAPVELAIDANVLQLENGISFFQLLPSDLFKAQWRLLGYLAKASNAVLSDQATSGRWLP